MVLSRGRAGGRSIAALGFLICAGLIGIALYLQYQVGLEPCPLCMMQRLTFFGLGLVFLIAALHGPKAGGLRIYGVLTVAIALVGLGLASQHVWLQWHPPAVSSCTASLFFQLGHYPVLRVFEKALRATGDCAKVDWTLMGMSIAQWSWVWFLALTGLAAMLYRAGTGSRSHLNDVVRAQAV